MSFRLRVRIQFEPRDATPAILPTCEIGVLLPIAEAPAEVPFGPCVLLLAEPVPGERPDIDFGHWDGNAWWSTRDERLDPVGYLRLPNKEEIVGLNAKAGVDERDGRWTVMINFETVH